MAFSSDETHYGAGRYPGQFGLPLEDYPLRVERIVQSVVSEIRSKESDPNLFFSLLEQLSRERRALADEQQTPNAHLFGLRRDSDEAVETSPIFVSDVEGYYSDLFLEKIGQLPASQGSMDRGETVFEWERVSVQVLCERQREVFRHPELKKQISKDTKKIKFTDYCPTTDPKGRREFYKFFLEVYRQNRLPPSHIPGDCYFFGTLYYRKEGALVPLSQYLGSFMEGQWKDLLLIHHQFFFIQETLDRIEEIFLDCISSKQSINELKQKIAHFSYLFSHCMPFGRGSAAIREWLEIALFRLHGHRIAYSNMNAIDLEAISSFSVQDFLRLYGL